MGRVTKAARSTDPPLMWPLTLFRLPRARSRGLGAHGGDAFAESGDESVDLTQDRVCGVAGYRPGAFYSLIGSPSIQCHTGAGDSGGSEAELVAPVLGAHRGSIERLQTEEAPWPTTRASRTPVQSHRHPGCLRPDACGRPACTRPIPRRDRHLPTRRVPDHVLGHQFNQALPGDPGPLRARSKAVMPPPTPQFSLMGRSPRCVDQRTICR
jgi:hypothetical protein